MASKHVFEPYEALLRSISSTSEKTWKAVEDEYLAATSGFDAEFATGDRTDGWYRSKARYFNDIIVALLRNASGKDVTTRQKVTSNLFEKLDMDVCFVRHGVPVIGAEVKQLGAPPHPRNKNKARPAVQDLHKRIREVAFTSVDFKIAYADPTPIGSFQNWIDRTPPGYFAFWAMRVRDDDDFRKVRTMLVNLRTYCNGVGAVFYGAVAESPTMYTARRVSELDIDRCIKEIAQRVAGD